MPAQTPITERIEPMRLYKVKELAQLTGCAERTLYTGAEDTTGKRLSVPRVTRLGTLERPLIRFRGDHIKAWLDESAGIKAAEPVAIEPEKRGRGRPRKNAEAAV